MLQINNGSDLYTFIYIYIYDTYLGSHGMGANQMGYRDRESSVNSR